ncbi:MAG: Divalent-cation tolerance protein CutA [Verrucomicrobia subdivision 3 bacterium]|nr:Divalent-cation tolerance protein CutA [Limisphaerales bacterium]MCS1416883.1 Divalent-cation tolerance protein CutA [Limisphaerales bacterium]
MSKPDTSPYMVLVTAPDHETATKLAKSALTQRLTACANLIPAIESHYWWQDNLEAASEHLILFKTVKKHLDPLKRLIEKEHPYDLPEFLCFEVDSSSPAYLKWLREECQTPQ